MARKLLRWRFLPKQGNAKSPTMSEPPSLPGLVVYVDDESSNRLVFERGFSHLFRIRTVASPGAALEVLAQEQVALLLTDQRMPEMTGHALLRWVADHHPDTIRIVVTAYRDLDAILRAINEGLVSRYILKPWDPIELRNVIAWALDAFALVQQNRAVAHRLQETERLFVLGTIAEGLLHDLGPPVARSLASSTRLLLLAAHAPFLATLVEGQAAAAPPLVASLRELPQLARELADDAARQRALLSELRRFVTGHARTSLTASPVAVLRYALSVCRHAADRWRGQLAYEGPAELPALKISEVDLGQVFVNLLTNAARALEHCAEPPGLVVVYAREDPGVVRFSVVDNGEGIAAERLTKVGTLFYSTRPEGAGIGLPLCRRLIGKAGGSFQLHSEEGRGTTVLFSIPCA